MAMMSRALRKAWARILPGVAGVALLGAFLCLSVWAEDKQDPAEAAPAAAPFPAASPTFWPVTMPMAAPMMPPPRQTSPS